MSVKSFFGDLWKKASSPTLYENVLILIGGMLVTTFVGDYLTKSFGMRGTSEYFTCAIVTTSLLFAVNCLVFYYRVAKPLNCDINMRTVILASLGPSIPGLLGILRLVKRVPGLGKIFAILLDRVFVRALVGIWPSFIYGTLSLLMFSCSPQKP